MLTQLNMAKDVAVVLLFSGKRKSGKDFVVAELTKLLDKETYDVMRLSVPLKKQYAFEHALDFESLLDSSSYKEKYRESMIAWGEAKRKEDSSFFCDLATRDACKPIWIIPDARRKTDLKYFRTKSKVIHVRVQASERTRRLRAWSFVAGIDDAESECDLDKETFDVVVDNDGHMNTLQTALQELTLLTQSALARAQSALASTNY